MHQNPSLRVFYSDYCVVPMPEKHRFPMHKYALLREYLIDNDIVPELCMIPAPMADVATVCTAHDKAYVERFMLGKLSAKEERRIGIPWSEAFVKRTMTSVGATVSALHTALRTGVSGALSGGTHHASYDMGGGFCVFNDLAIAAQVYLEAHPDGQVLVVDLDVHQGDGTALIFENEPRVFTFSMHGGANYPFNKVASNRDVGLSRSAGDSEFLDLLAAELSKLETMEPTLILYQAGVDGLQSDKLGTLNLTQAGLLQRDELVMRFARSLQAPLVITMGGGYAEPIDDSVEAYANTYRALRGIYGI